MPQINQFAVAPAQVQGGAIPRSVLARLLADQDIQQKASSSQSPVYHTGVGIAKVAAGAIGGALEGMELRNLEAQQQAERDQFADAVKAYRGLTTAPPSSTSSTPPANSAGGPAPGGPQVASAGAGPIPLSADGINWDEGGPQNDQKRALLMNYAVNNLGLAPPNAAALIGHADAESNFRPGVYNPTGERSHGLFQWNEDAGRWSPFLSWAQQNGRSPTDPFAQLDYAKVEASKMPGPGGGSMWDALAKAPDLSSASRAWMDGFEQPKVRDYGNRINLGNDALKAYQNAAPPNVASADMPAPNAQQVAGQGLPGDMQQPAADPSLRDTIVAAMNQGANNGASDDEGTSPGVHIISGVDEPPAAPAAPAPSPYGTIPPGTGDPSAQSLAMALANYGSRDMGGFSAPAGGTTFPGDPQPAMQQGTGIGDVPSAVSNTSNEIGDMQAAGLPSFGALPMDAGKRPSLSNDPTSQDPASPAPQMADVPLPPPRPNQALLDALTGPGPNAPATDSAMAYADQGASAPAAQAIQSAAPSPDMPAPNAAPAMGPGMPASIPPASLSPIGKNANFETPQAFNLAQSGGPNATMAAILGGGTPAAAGSVPQASGPDSPMQDGASSASGAPSSFSPGFSAGMNGGDLGQIAKAGYAKLLGYDPGSTPQPTPQQMALARQVDPNVEGRPGASQGQSFADAADAILRNPYASPQEREWIMQRMTSSYSIKDLPDGTTLRINNLTGEATPIYRAQVKHFGATKDGQIYDEFTGGGPNGQSTGNAFRLMTPDEKQAAGLPVDQPFQIGPNGKISGTTGQTINIGGAQSEYENAMSKAVAERHVGLMQGVEGAQERSRALNEMSSALDTLKAKGGTTGLGQPEMMQAQSAINSAANVFGFQPFDISDKEVINKLNKQIAASAAKSLSTRGATNFDFATMQSANPGLELSPTANQRLIGLAQQAEQRNIDVGQQIRSYAAQQQARGTKANPADVEQMITGYDASHHFHDPISGQDVTVNPRLPDLQGGAPGGTQGQGAPPRAVGGPPMFGNLPGTSPQQVPTGSLPGANTAPNSPVQLPVIASPADAMRLPPGTRFKDSNGNIRIVPGTAR